MYLLVVRQKDAVTQEFEMNIISVTSYDSPKYLSQFIKWIITTRQNFQGYKTRA